VPEFINRLRTATNELRHFHIGKHHNIYLYYTMGFPKGRVNDVSNFRPKTEGSN